LSACFYHRLHAYPIFSGCKADLGGDLYAELREELLKLFIEIYTVKKSPQLSTRNLNSIGAVAINALSHLADQLLRGLFEGLTEALGLLEHICASLSGALQELSCELFA
jgi:hypothetical protein